MSTAAGLGATRAWHEAHWAISTQAPEVVVAFLETAAARLGLTSACPSCHASPGVPCHTSRGNERRVTHTERPEVTR